jgi:hypothetical protein
MSDQKIISSRNLKLSKNINSLLKGTVSNTIEHLDNTAKLPDGPKYDPDLYQNADSTAKLTVVSVNKYKADSTSVNGKSIVSGLVPRKPIVTFRQDVRWYLGDMFSKYVQEVQHGINQARDEQMSIKPNDLIETLLTLANNEDKDSERVYKYLPIILTVYSQFVLNAKEDTLLIYLKKDIASCIPDLMGLVTEKHDIFLNYGEAQNTMIQSYLYFIALFAMETSTRTWVEAVPPNQKVAMALAKSLLQSKLTTKKNTKPSPVVKEDLSTKMIPCKTIGLVTFKYFVITKLQTFFTLTSDEYQFFMLTPDQIIEELNADISKEKLERAAKKLTETTSAAARASDSKKKAAAVSARNDPDEDEDAHDPDEDEDEDEDTQDPDKVELPLEAVASNPLPPKRIVTTKLKAKK